MGVLCVAQKLHKENLRMCVLCNTQHKENLRMGVLHGAANTAEYEELMRAHDCARSILNHVNQRVQECENHQRLIDIQRRLDKRPIENSTHPVIAEYKV